MAKKTLDNTNIPYYSARLAAALKAYADSGDLQNLLALSDMEQCDMSYALGWFPTYATLETGKTYTVTILATVGAKDDSIGIYTDGGTQTNIGSYTRAMSGTLRSFTFQAPAGTNQISFFHRPNDSDFDPETCVKWAVLTEGEKPARSWRPAPDDLRPVQRNVNVSSISAREFRLIKEGDWFYSSSRLQGPVIKKTSTTVQIYCNYSRDLRTYTRSSAQLSLTSSVKFMTDAETKEAVEGRWVTVPGLGAFVAGLESASAGSCSTFSLSSTTGLTQLRLAMLDGQGTFEDAFPCRGVAGIIVTNVAKAWYIPLASADVESRSGKDHVFNFGPVLANGKAWRIEISFNFSDTTWNVCSYPLS